MGFQLGNVLKGVYSKIKNDSALSTLSTNVFVNSVPKSATFPYIVLGNSSMTETPFNVFGQRGKETTIPIIIYDSSNSDLDIITIAERIDTIMDWKSDLSIDGSNHIVTQIQSSNLGYDINTAENTEVRFIVLNYKITSDES